MITITYVLFSSFSCFFSWAPSDFDSETADFEIVAFFCIFGDGLDIGDALFLLAAKFAFSSAFKAFASALAVSFAALSSALAASFAAILAALASTLAASLAAFSASLAANFFAFSFEICFSVYFAFFFTTFFGDLASLRAALAAFSSTFLFFT